MSVEMTASRTRVQAAQSHWDETKVRGPLGMVQVGRMGCDRSEAVPSLP